MVATHADMAGAAIIDHHPVLLGLEPETDYQYVMQGSDAAGDLYRSAVLTFTTLAATEVATPGTEWSSDGDGDDAALTIELAEVTEVVGFGVRSRSIGGTAPRSSSATGSWSTTRSWAPST